MEQKIIEILKEHIEGLENAEVCEDTQLIAKGLLECDQPFTCFGRSF